MNNKKTHLDPDFVKEISEFFASSEQGEALIEAVTELVDDEITRRMKEVVDAFNERLKDVVTEVIEVSVAKMKPTAADTVIFWLPERFTREMASKVSNDLRLAIDGQFRHMVFVKGSVEVELIGGNEILLPS